MHHRYTLTVSLVILAMCVSTSIIAQHDSLVLKNGDVIVGELKSMTKGVITIETGYSKNDFTIEWSGVKEIYSKARFLVTLKNGARINGTLQSVEKSSKVNILVPGAQPVATTLDDIVYLKGIKSDFWSRVSASIDFGLNITKANNLRQLSTRSTLGYMADKWMLDMYYDDIRSKQDSVEDTKRTETGVSYTYFLPRDWYAKADITLLSNTEQALDLRFTGKLGAGKYFVHTNKSYWGVGGGLSVNNERFTNGTPKRTSLEGYVGSELNLFDIGDLNLLSSVYVYPSFTESGRWRSDFKLDTKYDLPLDFYVRLGLTLNYDNRPAVVGNETDYVITFSVGWEL